MTKKSMLDSFPQVEKERDLLSLYLYDIEMKHCYDAIATEKELDGTRLRVKLYRAMGAQGGYVVITHLKQNTRIMTLDDANESMKGRADKYTLPLRLCLERLTAKRNELYQSNRSIVDDEE